jgi:hypothetical protein
LSLVASQVPRSVSVYAAFVCNALRLLHALPDLEIPLLALRIDAGLLPESQFLGMGAGFVPLETKDEPDAEIFFSASAADLCR